MMHSVSQVLRERRLIGPEDASCIGEKECGRIMMIGDLMFFCSSSGSREELCGGGVVRLTLNFSQSGVLFRTRVKIDHRDVDL